MSFELCAGKKKNREGRVELSVRFRLGKIDMQARTNLWVSPNFIKSEKYISSKGRQSVRLVLTSSRTKSAEAVNADDVKATWNKLLTFIESEYLKMKGNDLYKAWLVQTIEAFHRSMQPEVPQSTFILLIDDFLKEILATFRAVDLGEDLTITHEYNPFAVTGRERIMRHHHDGRLLFLIDLRQELQQLSSRP